MRPASCTRCPADAAPAWATLNSTPRLLVWAPCRPRRCCPGPSATARYGAGYSAHTRTRSTRTRTHSGRPNPCCGPPAPPQGDAGLWAPPRGRTQTRQGHAHRPPSGGHSRSTNLAKVESALQVPPPWCLKVELLDSSACPLVIKA